MLRRAMESSHFFRVKDYTLRNCGATVESTRARHRHGPNLAQYRYVQKKYSKRARAEAFWTMAVLIVLVLSSVVLAQLGETDAQRKARIEADETYYVQVACKFSEKACAVAKEDARRVICRLFPEDCYPAK